MIRRTSFAETRRSSMSFSRMYFAWPGVMEGVPTVAMREILGRKNRRTADFLIHLGRGFGASAPFPPLKDLFPRKRFGEKEMPAANTQEGSGIRAEERCWGASPVDSNVSQSSSGRSAWPMGESINFSSSQATDRFPFTPIVAWGAGEMSVHARSGFAPWAIIHPIPQFLTDTVGSRKR